MMLTSSEVENNTDAKGILNSIFSIADISN